jgi:hypothetical protein
MLHITEDRLQLHSNAAAQWQTLLRMPTGSVPLLGYLQSHLCVQFLASRFVASLECRVRRSNWVDELYKSFVQK